MPLEKPTSTPPTRRPPWPRVVLWLLSALVAYRICLVLFPRVHRPKAHIVETGEAAYGHLYHGAWKALSQALDDARPSVPSIGDLSPTKGIPVETIDEPTAVDAIALAEGALSALQQSHRMFVSNLEGHKLSVIYQRAQQGIVVTAGANDLAVILIQLRLLRRTGSLLPVEVFLLGQDEYEDKVCRETLPRLNAQCKILQEHIDATPLARMPNGSKARRILANEPLHKLLAIFFSTFEDVLLLDPATLVYNNADIVLREEPFLSTGLILWPDFWASTESPRLYSVQDTVPDWRSYGDDMRTVDMGQLLVSKSQHSTTLLLAIYYAYFGEALYDSLLMQSTAGERGSQSIKSAAHYLRTPYYMIRRYVEAVGYPDLDKSTHDFRGVAMLQATPSDDFHRQPKDRQRPLFVRANNPGLHPAHIMDAGVTAFTATTPNAAPASNGLRKTRVKAHRMWQWFSARHASNGWRDPDPERAVWEEIWQVACKDAGDFASWPRNERSSTMQTCDRITRHREALGWGALFDV